MRQLPGTGTTTVGCEQGRRQLQVRLTVQTTPNPNFRRIDAAVLRPAADGETEASVLLQVSTVMGRFSCAHAASPWWKCWWPSP